MLTNCLYNLADWEQTRILFTMFSTTRPGHPPKVTDVRVPIAVRVARTGSQHMHTRTTPRLIFIPPCEVYRVSWPPNPFLMRNISKNLKAYTKLPFAHFLWPSPGQSTSWPCCTGMMCCLPSRYSRRSHPPCSRLARRSSTRGQYKCTLSLSLPEFWWEIVVVDYYKSLLIFLQ